MDQDKLAFFVTKFRALDDEEFAETCQRVESLSDEAAAAIAKVASERGKVLPESDSASGRSPTELTEAQRSEQTRLAIELWNSPLSRRVEFQFALHAIVFSSSLLGTTGLRFGALWLLALCAILYYPAKKLGRNYTKSICANAEISLDQKRTSLSKSSMVLWPTLLVAALLGTLLANVLRGA